MEQIYNDGKYAIELDKPKGIFHVFKSGKLFYKTSILAEAYQSIKDAQNEELGISLDIETIDYNEKKKQLIKSEDLYYSSQRKYLKCYSSFKEKAEVYDSIHYIDSYEELLHMIKALPKDGELVYRGINNATFKSYASSQRRYLVGNDSNLQNYGMKFGMKVPYKNFIENIVSTIRNNNDFSEWLSNNAISDKNDFLILAALQHYATCAPLLDFTTNIYSSLFFCVDGAGKPFKPKSSKHNKNTTKKEARERRISNYITLYVVNGNIDWLQYDLQAVVSEWKAKTDSLKKDPNNSSISFSDNDIRLNVLPYESFSDIDFVTVRPSDGPDSYVRDDSIRKIHLWNERVEAQNGFFILNNTQSVPLFELLQVSGTDVKVQAYEIHKKLVPAIKRICRKHKVTRETIYPITVNSIRLLNALRKDISEK